MRIFSCLANLPHLIQVMLLVANLPTVVALQDSNPLSDIPFKPFSDFVETTFGSTISLSTVLLLIFSVLENPGLFSLHAQQQCSIYEGENWSTSSGWVRHLACALQDRWGEDSQQLLQQHDMATEFIRDQTLQVISTKLVALAEILQYYPLDDEGNFLGKLQPVSLKAIQPILMICPDAVVCETLSCNPQLLLQATKIRDIPKVTLIKKWYHV